MPGLYDPVAGATRFLVNMPGDWLDRPVAGPVEAVLGIPVSLINDARAFGLAELRLGAGRGADSMVGLTLGTGVGGVIAIDGRVVLGHDGTAGEVGHHTIDPDGPPCNCGNNGCLEAFARADRIAAACGTDDRRGGRRGGARWRCARARGPGQRRPLPRDRDRQHDRPALARSGRHRRWDRRLRRPAAGAIRDELRRRVQTTSLSEVEIVTAELGTWAGAIGAAVHGAEAAEVAGRLGGRVGAGGR